MSRTCCDPTEVLDSLVFLSLVALEACSITEVDSVAEGVFAGEWAGVFIHVFAEMS